MTHRTNSKRGFTAVELVLVIVVLAIVVTVTMVQVDKRRQARLREESAANLKTLLSVVLGLKNRTHEYTMGDWLPLSSNPGQLSPQFLTKEATSLRISEHPYAFISPAHPDVERLRREALIDAKSQWTDSSYFYIPYRLTREESGLKFVEAYRAAIEKGTNIPNSISEPVSKNGPFVRYTPSAPLMIERPGLQRGGSSVLFWDGHVEFIPYPGKWPMTEKFIKALESLDELKESSVDAIEK